MMRSVPGCKGPGPSLTELCQGGRAAAGRALRRGGAWHKKIDHSISLTENQNATAITCHACASKARLHGKEDNISGVETRISQASPGYSSFHLLGKVLIFDKLEASGHFIFIQKS